MINGKNLKKKNLKLAARVFVAAALLTVLLSAAVITGRAAGGVDVSVRVGYSNKTVFEYKTVPVAVTLTNTSDKEIRGTVDVSPSFGMTYYYNVTETHFTREFVLPAGVEKTLEIPFSSQGYNFSTVKCTVTDSRGKTLETKDISVKFDDRPFLVGYITDSDKDQAFGQSLGTIPSINGGNVYIETLWPGNFPSSEALINEFDMLLVGNVDFSASSSFSAKQISLIRQFAANGGILALGLGDRGAEALRLIEPFLASSPAQAAKKGEDLELLGSTLRTATGKLITPHVEAPLAASDLTDDNFIEKQSYSRHIGLNIAVFPFSIADSAILKSADNQMWLFYLLESDLTWVPNGSSYSNAFLTKDVYRRTPSALVIFLLMGAYIAVGIILVFVKLRKKKLEKWIWLGIPASAIAFSLIFILYGAISRGGDSASVINFVYLNETGRNSAETVAGVYASSGGKYEISFADLDAVGISHEWGRLSGTGNVSPHDIKYGDCATHVFTGVTKDSYIMSADDYTDTTYSTLQVTFTRSGAPGNEKAVARVKNTSGRPLTGVFLYNGSKYLSAGDLAVGQEIDLDVSDMLFTPWSGLSGSGFSDLLYDSCYSKAGLSREDAEDMVNVIYRSGWQGGYYYYSNQDDWFADLRSFSTAELYQRGLLLEKIGTMLASNFAKTPTVDYGIHLWLVAFDDDYCPDLYINDKKLSKTVGQTVLIQNIPLHDFYDVSYPGTDFYQAATGAFDLSGNATDKIIIDSDGNGYLVYPLFTAADLSNHPLNLEGQLDITWRITGHPEVELNPEIYLLGNVAKYSDAIPGADKPGTASFSRVDGMNYFIVEGTLWPDWLQNYYYNYVGGPMFSLSGGNLSGSSGIYFDSVSEWKDVAAPAAKAESDTTYALLLVFAFGKSDALVLQELGAVPEITSATFSPTGMIDTTTYGYSGYYPGIIAY